MMRLKELLLTSTVIAVVVSAVVCPICYFFLNHFFGVFLNPDREAIEGYKIEIHERLWGEDRLTILGSTSNDEKLIPIMPAIHVEFFDGDGKFLAERTERVDALISQKKENFEVTIRKPWHMEIWGDELDFTFEIIDSPRAYLPPAPE
ncbi:hypothetical protein MLD52_20765 [Puniceicoccaceae bacterium K14]|nr:hypothetical protein [Puniceicoccaceae bacterium K14]